MVSWKRNLAAVWLTQFCSLTAFCLSLPFAPFFIQDLGVTDPAAVKVWTAVYYSAAWLPMALMAPVWGMLADRYGRKMMMVRANTAAMIVMILMASARSVEALIMMRVLQGLFTGTVTAAATLVAGNTPVERHGTALGSLAGAVFSGAMMGQFCGGFLADRYGYRLPYLVSSAIMLVSVLIVVFLVKEEFVRRPASPPAPWQVRLNRLGPGKPILIIILWIALVRHFDMPYFPLLVQEAHGQLKGASSLTGTINGIASIGAMLAAVLLGRLSDRGSPAAISRVAAIGAGLFMLIIGLYPSLAVIFPARFMMAFFAAGLEPVFLAWLSRSTPEERRGAVLGLAVTARSLGWVLAPLLSAVVAVRASLRAIYLVGPLLYLLLIPIVVFVSRKLAHIPPSGKRPDVDGGV